jgi:hypothetical protein
MLLLPPKICPRFILPRSLSEKSQMRFPCEDPPLSSQGENFSSQQEKAPPDCGQGFSFAL